MDYSKMKSSIDRAILKSPLDVAAYDDKFALCRDYEGAEFRLAHEWNQALQEEIRAGLKLAVDTRDFKTAEEFDNAVNGNIPSGWAWFDSDVELMNEVQAYGSVAWGAHDGNGYNVASGDGQFPLFMFDRTKLHNREDYWLRDVASATHFSYVNSDGLAYYHGASDSYGVRPAFCIG